MSVAGLGADTEVVLLLCGRFGGESKEPHAPLSATEYGELARWLKERELRPADMLTEAVKEKFGELVHAKLGGVRIEFLLGRGAALALSVERWQRAGLWVISRADAFYPQRYRQLFRHSAPPLLFGAGEQALLERGGLAIVGARKASDEALRFTAQVATHCAHDGFAVVSGGARGVDSAAMQAAVDAGGTALGVLACDLLKSSMSRSNRSAIQAGRLVLVSPFSPEAGFNAGNAMARNRLIYALADYALVVDSTRDSGGTWAGATENMRHGWVPLYVRVPDEGGGNSALLANGARNFSFDPTSSDELSLFLETGLPQSTQDAESSRSDQAQFIEVAAGTPDCHEPETAACQRTDVIAEVSTVQLVEEASVSLQPNVPTAEHSAEEILAPVFEPLDMYPVFLARIEVLLKVGMKTEVEVAQALGLDDRQAKAWLKQATEQRRLKKKMVLCKEVGKKKAHYELNPQAALC
jgi:predicted Rossmann fold nucleotide-binding protein DprA/Smf involved in DNA uptake